MKPIKNDICSQCGKSYDPTLGECPSCKTKGPFSEQAHLFEAQSRVGVARNIIFFLVGWLGFQVIAVIVSLFVTTRVKINNPVATNEELIELISSPSVTGIVNIASYFILIGVMLLIALPVLKEIFKSFKNYKNIFKGLGYGAILIVTSMLWSLIAGFIRPSASEGNANQTTIVQILNIYSVSGFIAFGLIGPFTEELAYRVGLFSFGARINRFLAYAVSILVFGLIHFDFTSIGSDAFFDELINLPDYLIAGALLGAAYRKHGFATSYVAHATNNVIGVLLILLANK